jgi:predicted GIY-YIG superfamily endonuclease
MTAYQGKELIYEECNSDIRDAIARESPRKKWSRAKKVALMNRLIPSWLDLGPDVLQDA